MTAIPLPYLPPVSPPTIAWDAVLLIANAVVAAVAIVAMSEATKDETDSKPDADSEECASGDCDDSNPASDTKRRPPVKGKEFRGGKKSSRDNWGPYSKEKDFQRWWHRRGKKEWGGKDLEAKDLDAAHRYWVNQGKPKVK